MLWHDGLAAATKPIAKPRRQIYRRSSNESGDREA
jgi:hypothetical protein